MFGYAGTILIVDLSSRTIEKMPLTENLTRKYLGGLGVNAKLLFDHTRAGIEPLSPENVLIFGTGPLTASGAQTSNRFTVTTKSPLTGTILDANSDGGICVWLSSNG